VLLSELRNTVVAMCAFVENDASRAAEDRARADG
jgi:hypothetical protein